ncbi:alpha/beta fold hydrolase [Sulfurimonas sp.]|uniref:alpha/beta fold hydrolase n=1 Tax=Sulfurimonas sp. TaxID=2022749 RepID=UPI003D0C0F13
MKKVFLGIFLSIVGVFSLFYILTSGRYSVPSTLSSDKTISHIKLKDTLFHAQTFGNPKNQVVIVVHGGPGWDYKSLLPIQKLSDEFFVVFYDQKGTGLSPRVDPKELTLQSYFQDLDAIIDYYSKSKKVDLIGHSWGAMLVSGYIGKYPQKVKHAVLAEPGFLTTKMIKEADIYFGPKWDIGFLLHASKVWFESLHIDSKDKDSRSDYFIANVAPYANPEYYCNGIIPDVGLEVFRASASSASNVNNLIVDSKGEIDIDLIKGVENFPEKVLFLASQCNKKIGVKFQKKQMKYFKSAELKIIKNSGHMMFAEQPEQTVSIVRKYLKTDT